MPNSNHLIYDYLIIHLWIQDNCIYFLCVCVVYVCSSLCRNAHPMCVFVCVCKTRKINIVDISIFLLVFSILILRPELFLNPEKAILARLADQSVPRICLAPPLPALQLEAHTNFPGVLHRFWESKHRLLFLFGQHFTH